MFSSRMASGPSMTMLPGLLYVTLFTVAAPLIDYVRAACC
jgi:hypothetical protein